MEKARLNQLPTVVTNAFHPDFVFLVTADKVQHFPARQWQLKDYQHMLHERLGSEYELFEWHSCVVAANDAQLFIIMPNYQKVSDLA